MTSFVRTELVKTGQDRVFFHHIPLPCIQFKVEKSVSLAYALDEDDCYSYMRLILPGFKALAVNYHVIIIKERVSK